MVVAGGRVPPSSTTRVLKIPGFHLLSERMVQSHSRSPKPFTNEVSVLVL